jgi:HEAT repeat protein
MKDFLASLWQRRWLRAVGLVLIFVAILMLHPFLRQTVFGPTIDGIPWCVWEDEARRQVDRRERSWFAQILEKVGLSKEGGPGLDIASAAALPVHIHLAEDSDVKVRRVALELLARHAPTHDAETHPVLTRHLNDDDQHCRIAAAQGVWHGRTDKAGLKVMLAMAENTEGKLAALATMHLAEAARDAPELFDPLAKLTFSENKLVRTWAVFAMGHFGPRGVPLLERIMKERDPRMQKFAARSAARLGEHGAKLTPVLESLRQSGDPSVIAAASHALHCIDPKRFPKPAEDD